MQVRSFLDGHLAIVYVDELPADRKFVFYRQKAWKRSLTGDHQITEPEIAAGMKVNTIPGRISAMSCL